MTAAVCSLVAQGEFLPTGDWGKSSDRVFLGVAYLTGIAVETPVSLEPLGVTALLDWFFSVCCPGGTRCCTGALLHRDSCSTTTYPVHDIDGSLDCCLIG